MIDQLKLELEASRDLLRDTKQKNTMLHKELLEKEQTHLRELSREQGRTRAAENKAKALQLRL